MRKDGITLRDIGRAMDCGTTMAHHLSRVGEGYLRRLSHVKYVLEALISIGETDA